MMRGKGAPLSEDQEPWWWMNVDETGFHTHRDSVTLSTICHLHLKDSSYLQFPSLINWGFHSP